MNTPSEALRAMLSANFPALTPGEDLLRRLAPLVPLRRLGRGRTLFAQGQPTAAVYAVITGEIETRFIGPDGQVSSLDHVPPPRIFGLAAFVTGQPSSYEALATVPSQVLSISEPAYRLLMDELPGFARALMREFALRFDSTMRLLEAARHRSAAERFSLALAQMAHRRALGEHDADGWKPVAATQAELATLASLSRQTVNQLLRQAVAEGRLRSSYGRMWIKPAPER